MSAIEQSDEEATAQIVRVIAYVFAVASLVFGALEAQNVVGQAPHLAIWWNVLAIAVIFGIPLAMGVMARWSSLRLIRVVAAALAIGYLGAMLLLPLALVEGHLQADLQAPWIFQLTVIGTSAAAIAWPHWSVWGLIAAMAGLLAADRIIASSENITNIALQDALQALMFNSIFAALTVVSVAAGRTLDAAGSAARAETAATAVAVSLEHERSRIAALVHDGVLATLLAAARAKGVLGSAVAGQAATTLEQLVQHRDGTRLDESVPAQQLAWMLQGMTTEISPAAEFSYRVDSTVSLSGALARTFREAAAEALRNSMRHAVHPDHPTSRAVHVDVDERLVRVVVLDDGDGFDPRDVAPTRLGLKVSVIGRMASQPGGHASIRSTSTQGTAVILEWRPT